MPRNARFYLLVACALSLGACNSNGGDTSPTPEAEAVAPAVAATDGSGSGASEAAEVEAGSGVPAAEEAVGSIPVEPEPPQPSPQEQARAEIQGFGPIDGLARDMIWSVPEDPIPEVLYATREDLENRHYLTCDELNLHVWYERVRDIGGAYAGVGSDQAYTFIGWMRPQIAWLTDYDPWVRTVHKIYLLAFERSENIEQFRAFWSEETEDETWALIQERWADDVDMRLMASVWSGWRYKINRRLRNYQRILRTAEIPSFLTDEETYNFVRDFTMSGRVRPILANLLDETALRGIGETSRELDVPIRVFYVSNAEDYWRYPDNFRENFRQLHFDERSLILRSNATKSRNGDYRYAAQPALNFRAWLNEPYVRRINDIWLHPRVDNEEHIPVSFIDDEPVDRGGR